jgi:putative toxin-antitoxin system antitoxin component (TIGR02293 family)
MSAVTTNNEGVDVSPPVGLISISVRAGEIFANQEKALHWLQSPNPSLEGQTPLEAARTAEGYQEADDILTRIEHGVLRGRRPY